MLSPCTTEVGICACVKDSWGQRLVNPCCLWKFIKPHLGGWLLLSCKSLLRAAALKSKTSCRNASSYIVNAEGDDCIKACQRLPRVNLGRQSMSIKQSKVLSSDGARHIEVFIWSQIWSRSVRKLLYKIFGSPQLGYGCKMTQDYWLTLQEVTLFSKLSLAQLCEDKRLENWVPLLEVRFSREDDIVFKTLWWLHV